MGILFEFPGVEFELAKKKVPAHSGNAFHAAGLNAWQVDALFSLMREGFVLENLQGEITQFNRAALKILETSSEHLLGKKLFSLERQVLPTNAHISEVQELPNAIVHRTKAPAPNQIIALPLQDGSLRWLQINAFPIVDPTSKEMIRILSTFQDVTDWHEAQRSHQRVADFRGAILDASSYSIVATDQHGRITLFNSMAEKLLGCPAAQVVGKTDLIQFFDFFEVVERCQERNLKLNENLEPGFASLVAPVSHHEKIEAEWSWVRADQQRVRIFLSMTPLRDETGELMGYLFFARDLTEELKLRKTIEEQRSKLADAAKMVTLVDMASGVAHEINNPLAIIYGKIGRMERMLAAGQFSREDFQNDLAKIRSTAERIAAIVKSMQHFSRSDTDKEPFHEQKLGQIIQEAVHLCQKSLEAKGIRFDVKGEVSGSLLAKGSQISQVLWSLIRNSAEAIGNLEQKWIVLEMQEMGPAQMRLTITDSGLGLSQEVVKKIMQPFFTTKDIGKGAGLGLSVAKGIIEEHGGQLWYDSSHPNTRFVIDLKTLQKKKSAA